MTRRWSTPTASATTTPTCGPAHHRTRTSRSSIATPRATGRPRRPWATGAGPGAASRSGADDRPADPVPSRAPGQGLAGSSADRMASGLPIAAAGVTAAAAGSDDLADLVAPPTRPQAPSAQPPITRPPSGHFPTTSAAGRRPSVSSTREQPAVDHDGPSWERARRYEAYPTIKTRASLPGIPRIALWGGALVLAAMALFFLPGPVQQRWRRDPRVVGQPDPVRFGGDGVTDGHRGAIAHRTDLHDQEGRHAEQDRQEVQGDRGPDPRGQQGHDPERDPRRGSSSRCPGRRDRSSAEAPSASATD